MSQPGDQPPQPGPDLRRKVGKPLDNLALELFGGAPADLAMADKLFRAMDLGRFEDEGAAPGPRTEGGRISWKLKPRDRRTVEELDELVNGALTDCSPWERMLVEKREGLSRITYKFLLTTGVQAHAGSLEFWGEPVREVLDEKAKRGKSA